LIFCTIFPAEFFENFKSDFAFLCPAATFLNIFQNKEKIIKNTEKATFDAKTYFSKISFFKNLYFMEKYFKIFKMFEKIIFCQKTK